MSQFTIITKGVAASYIKDDLWKVLFPVNDCHSLKLKLDTNPNGISLGQQGGRVEISVTDPLTRTAKGANYDDFLDLTGEGVHGELIMKDGKFSSMDAVLMSIESAELSVFDYVDLPYRLIDRDGTPAATEFQKTGNCGQAVVEGGELTIQVSGPDVNFSMTFSADTTVVFDNDCDETPVSEFGDIDMLYNIICDADEDSRRFMMDKEAEAEGGGGGIASAAPLMASSGTRNGTVTREAVVARAIPESPTSGLPCNKFRISDPRTLP